MVAWQTPGEFRFQIDEAAAEPLPMARLADLLRDLAVIFGERGAVRFAGTGAGAAVPVIRVERGALSAVRERVAAVGRGAGPADAMRAYHALDDRLRQGGLTATLFDAAGEALLLFSGRGNADAVQIRQDGSIDGEVVRVGGQSEEARILLRSGDEVLADITASRELAKELARHLYEPVRLHGPGRWTRLGGGRWVLDGLRVERFDVLADDSLRDALAALQALQSRWDGPDGRGPAARRGAPGA